jgi:SAM-dependent methyltransferase
MNEGWEDRAEAWLVWARTPGHDAYWSYRDSFFVEIVPPPCGMTLEVGCGEGRVTRDLRARGHDVTGLDPSPTLVAAAQAADPAGPYVVATAETLPFGDETFDLVVFYNTLMDVNDMPTAVREAARVLRAGGRVAACVTHPFTDAGRWMADSSAFVIEGAYLEENDFATRLERDGLTFLFEGRRMPLVSYTRAFEAAGLLIDRIREPRPAEQHRSWERWSRLPMFLHLGAVKPRQAARWA